MKILRLIGLAITLLPGSLLYAQKSISEGTIVYDITIQTGNSIPPKTDAQVASSKTVYLKGSNSRTDQVTFLGNEINIHDAKSGSAVILKEFSGQKLMIKLTKDNWIENNKNFGDVKFDLTSETKTIAGFTAKKAIAKLAGGNQTFTVWYSPDLLIVNKDYDPTFASLPGLPLEYEIESGQLKFKYTVSKINFEPVLVSKFDFPKSGYRVMTFEENKQMRKGGQ